MITGPVSPGSLSVVPFDEGLLDLSWEWLQDHELHTLVRAPKLDRESQRRWFRALPDRTDYLVWGLALDGQPIGVFGLKNVDDTSGEYFVYIGLKDLWGKGFGRFMHTNILRLAREHGLERLWGIANSERTLRAHLSYGWRPAGHDESGVPILEIDVPSDS